LAGVFGALPLRALAFEQVHQALVLIQHLTSSLDQLRQFHRRFELASGHDSRIASDAPPTLDIGY
jgi:hypothetical protein